MSVLSEIPVTSGEVKVRGKVAYARYSNTFNNFSYFLN